MPVALGFVAVICERKAANSFQVDIRELASHPALCESLREALLLVPLQGLPFPLALPLVVVDPLRLHVRACPLELPSGVVHMQAFSCCYRGDPTA